MIILSPEKIRVSSLSLSCDCPFKRQLCSAGFWRLAQVVTGANPTVTASPKPKTAMFLKLFRKTDFSEMLSIIDLLFDKFCVCYKAVLLSMLTRSMPKDLSL